MKMFTYVVKLITRENISKHVENISKHAIEGDITHIVVDIRNGGTLYIGKGIKTYDLDTEWRGKTLKGSYETLEACLWDGFSFATDFNTREGGVYETPLAPDSLRVVLSDFFGV